MASWRRSRPRSRSRPLSSRAAWQAPGRGKAAALRRARRVSLAQSAAELRFSGCTRDGRTFPIGHPGAARWLRPRYARSSATRAPPSLPPLSAVPSATAAAPPLRTDVRRQHSQLPSRLRRRLRLPARGGRSASVRPGSAAHLWRPHGLPRVLDEQQELERVEWGRFEVEPLIEAGSLGVLRVDQDRPDPGLLGQP